jgi:hypothetical protein
MTDSELILEYRHIFDNLSEYVLVKNSGGGYVLFSIKKQGYVMLENSENLDDLLIKKGIRVVNDAKEVRDPNFVHYVQVWNEEEKKYILVPEKEITAYMKKKQSNKNE